MDAEHLIFNNFITNAAFPWMQIQELQDFWLWHANVFLPMLLADDSWVYVSSINQCFAYDDFMQYLNSIDVDLPINISNASCATGNIDPNNTAVINPNVTTPKDYALLNQQ